MQRLAWRDTLLLAMVGFGFWPVAVQPLGDVACGTLLWRVGGKLHVTVVVKATFELEPDGEAKPTAPEPLRTDRGEVAPYLGLTDVVVTAAHAHACPPTPVTAVAVRVAVIRDWPLLDKRVLVYGQDPRVGAGRSLFTKAPVVVPEGTAGRQAVLLNPRDPSRPVEFGLLPVDHPQRRSLLRSRDAPEPAAGVMDIEEGFAWEYFQVAPLDQRIPYLRGDEWIVLDGLHPTLPRVQCRLPGAHAEVRVYPPSMRVADGATFHVAMQPDRLNIDADSLRCSVLWRGSFPVADEISARALTLLAALALPHGPSQLVQSGQPIEEPLSIDRVDRSAPAPAPPTDDGVEEEVDPNAETRKLERVRIAGLGEPAREAAPESDADPLGATGAATLIREPQAAPVRSDRTAPPDEPALAAPSPATPTDDGDPGPPTVRLGTTPPEDALLRGAAGSEPPPPIRAKPTIPYFEPEFRTDGAVGQPFADPTSPSPSEPSSQDVPRRPDAGTQLGVGIERARTGSSSTAPAESGVERRRVAAGGEARAGAAVEEGATTRLRRGRSEEGRRPARSKKPIVPSRAELPMYLPSEAKRWAQVAPKSTPLPHSEGPAAVPPPTSRLELTSEGALSVRFLDSAALRQLDEEEPPTAVAPGMPGRAGVGEVSSEALSAWAEAKQFGSAGHVLRPQAVPGAPWTSGSGVQPTNPPNAASMTPSDLPLVEVDELEGTLSETLSVRDEDVAIVDEQTGRAMTATRAPYGDIDDEETSVSGGSQEPPDGGSDELG